MDTLDLNGMSSVEVLSLVRQERQIFRGTMNVLIANQVSGTEAVRLVRRGQQLLCPICSATIKTVPSKWGPGMPLHAIECPKDQRHFMIHCEDKNAVNEMRARMKARFGRA